MKWWSRWVPPPYELACRASALLVCHDPIENWQAALVLPQAGGVLETLLHELVRGLVAGLSSFRHSRAMTSNANEQVLFALQDVISTALKRWLDENKPELLHAFREAFGQNSVLKRHPDDTASKSEVQFLGTSEIATRWRLNPETVRRMVRDGRLPRTSVSGRRILVPFNAILACEKGGVPRN